MLRYRKNGIQPINIISFLLVGIAITVILTLNMVPITTGTEVDTRGRYVYDNANILSPEVVLNLNAYLYEIDKASGYEVCISFPTETLDDLEVIDWFNAKGIGKEGKDNGACLFLFPDNTWYMAIGYGNDKISIPASKTYGDQILQNSSNLPLSILRYIDKLTGKLDEPQEQKMNVYSFISENSGVIFAWMLTISLLLLLLQQSDGFQLFDLISPIMLALIILLIISINFASSLDENYYTAYGVITSTSKDSEPFTRTHVHSDGERTWTTISHHIRYTNDVIIKCQNQKDYSHRFSSEDFKSAWEHDVNDMNELHMSINGNNIYSIYNIHDFSGGLSKGDGVGGIL